MKCRRLIILCLFLMAAGCGEPGEKLPYELADAAAALYLLLVDAALVSDINSEHEERS